MPEIIARSCCSRYFATSQPRLTVPTTLAFGTRTLSKDVSQTGERPEISSVGFVVAVFKECGPEHGNAERDQRLASADCRHLLAHDFCLLRIEARATVFFRPVRHGPALVAHPFKPDALRLG